MKFLPLSVLGLVATLAMTTTAGAADSGPFVFPDYRNGAEITARCEAILKDMAAQEAQVAAGGTSDNVLVGMDRLSQTVDDGLGPISFIANVHPDKGLRDAAEACELRYQAFASKLYQNAKIYARVKAFAPADPIDAQLRDDLMASFDDAGVALPTAARARARALNNEIGKLAQTFERRVREDKTRVPFTVAELEGVPEAAWAKAPRDAKGRVLVGLDYPSYNPVVESARNAATRERIWRAFQSRGGAANLKTLGELGQKRRDYARLFGLPSYADFTLRRRMAGSVPNVQRFLGEVKGVVEQRELRDIADLREAKAADLKQPAERTKLKRWDAPYYIERVKRERFALDQDSFRRYFPPQASVDFAMALSGKLFNVGFKPLEQKLWHADARAYEVVELGSGKLLATLYVDLYPRADKYGHAAVWPMRGSSTLAGRLPTAALVTNFDRNGLTLDELETMLHEFGHALHVTLSATRYSSNAGTSVKLDFVEAPSQMLEEWVYDAKVLALFQEVCKTCEPVPADLLERAIRSRSFAKGLQFSRQHLYASYDLALYSKAAPEPMSTWARMEGATPLGHEKGTMFPAAFAHLAGGYGAGYYAYLWSLATAQDLHTAFAADPLDAKVGRRYRDVVLGNGSQVDANELVGRFLGRAPSNKAFFEWLNR
ncbi:M3 family metallopeptidase [uncultured Methylibium sp.]|uniref:M3 family metallopeptidase n=1 Tax=uncultured Methylibium sp. TaxID=381093 RepID=UPI0025D66CDC|nr:M3 family metallopeptidase [uncultured Methylibium sp.]